MINTVWDFLRGEVFTVLGTISSVISLIVTIWVFINVRSIKNQFRFTARVPGLVKKLDRHASRIANYRNDFENSLSQIDEELNETKVTLESLGRKLNRQTKHQVTEVFRIIEVYNSGEKDRDSLWRIYLTLRRIVREVEELQEDLKWER